NDFGALTNHLFSKGYKPEEMKAAFLCSISQKNGRSYDIFRNRIMFPVIDVKGDIIAFGGRTIGNDPNESKYINSSDTPVFNKRRNLFALNFAKSDCAEQLILCEGYMDVVALHGAGFTNAVASLGTALTGDQARLMKRYTKSVIISYDADEAGQRAADKAFNLLGEVGLETRLLKVEDAKDPDEYIKKFGKEAFSRLLNRSRSRFDFKFAAILAKYDVSKTEERVKAASDAADFLSRIWSEVERDVYARQVADKLEIPLDSLKNDIKRKIAKRTREEKREKTREVIRKAEGYGDRVNPDRMKNLGAAGAEDTILGILAMYPELIPEARDTVGLAPEDFVTEFNRKVYEKMTELGSAFDVGLLGDSFSQDEISRIVKNTVSRQGLTENGMTVVTQCAEKLRQNRQKQSFSLEELIASKRNKKHDT
ncbi:MAG: toprim domain-containing protein, partial [Clostridia bacterium]|nr:toprim domain-containing protein [Clostridia bacterium]